MPIAPTVASRTLAGSAVTAATITGLSGTIEYGVEVRLDPDATDPVYFRADGTTAVASVGAGKGICWPGQSAFMPKGLILNADLANISIIGTGVVSLTAI